MRLNVVGMPVAAIRVVGHHDVRSQVADDLDERADGFVLVGVAKPLRTPPVARLGAGHAGIAPPAGATEVDGPVEAQRLQRGRQLTDPVAAELVCVVHGQLRPLVTDDLALFAERARDDLHLRSARHVVSNRGPVGDALVVGMGMHEQQPRSLLHGRHPTRGLRGKGFRGLNA